MTVRVVRIMEYTYKTPEQAIEDMARWQVQGTYYPRGLGNPTTITSAVLPMTLLEPEPEPEPDYNSIHGFEQEFSAESPFCGAMVVRDGYGDTCGLPREHPIHHRTPAPEEPKS